MDVTITDLQIILNKYYVKSLVSVEITSTLWIDWILLNKSNNKTTIINLMTTYVAGWPSSQLPVHTFPRQLIVVNDIWFLARFYFRFT